MSDVPSAHVGTTAPDAWLEANQRYLRAECARMQALLQAQLVDEPGTGTVEAAEAAVARARKGVPGGPALDFLGTAFSLSPFERDLLLLAAGVELDAQVAALCAAANGRPSARFATFALALAVLPDAHWSALTPDSPLRQCRLLEVSARPLTTSALRIDERILHCLVGANALDERLRPVVRPLTAAECPVLLHEQTAARIADACRRAPGEWPIVQIWGDDGEAQLQVAARAAARLGLSLHVLRGDDVPAAADERWMLGALWAREAPLLESALVVQNVPGANLRALIDLIDVLGPPLFVATPEPIDLAMPSVAFEVAKPGATERSRLWRVALGPVAGNLDGALDLVGVQYRLGAGSIERLAAAVREAVEDGADARSALARTCRGRTAHDLDALAERIEPSASWADIVLPEATVGTLREIAAQVRHRITVYDLWGFRSLGTRGLGITALFTGASGTGKTMAAEVLAGEVGLDLYRIDLSGVVSKYIGETEKNLRRVFDAADETGAILFFDEADAIFGKRSEVKDSHDRYANIETSYLLQRMEAYQGLAILATNMKHALDAAFLRRLRFVVQFPFPDSAMRHDIWQRIFPDAMPRGALDVSRLARLNVSGGSIRNIAMNAAFLAADRGEPLEMSHLLHATRTEYTKIDRALTAAETAGWTA
jgi:hypothetical protein